MRWFKTLSALMLVGLLAACNTQVPTGDGTRPTITSFDASPSTITAGESSTLSWSVSDATSLTLNPGNIDVTGKTSQVVSPAATTLYTLTAANAAGSVEATTSVTVSTGESDGTYSNSGFVSLTETEYGSTPSISGSGIFFTLDAAQPIPDDDDPLTDFADTCFVYAEGDEPPVPNPSPDPQEVAYLDAGDPLTVRSGATVYATLKRQTSQDVISYSTDPTSPPDSPLPAADLSVTIPGVAGGFPAFEDKAFPDVPAFSLTAPVDPGSITESTSFAWTGNSTSAFVILSGMGQNSEDNTISFYCIARDDGSFSIPDEAKTALDAEGFTTGSLTLAGRQGSARYRDGDTLLYLSVGRYTTFGNFGPASRP